MTLYLRSFISHNVPHGPQSNTMYFPELAAGGGGGSGGGECVCVTVGGGRGK